MAFLKMTIALVVLGILYVRMIKREIPSPISGAQAVVPVPLGVVSLLLSFFLFTVIAMGLLALGVDPSGFPAVLRSLFSAFCMAGFPEEFTKMLMMLLSLFLFRKRIKNVYEILLIGAGTGFGFTLFEEFLYGSGSVASLVIRILTVGAHMIFGLIMAGYLGRARLARRSGSGSVWGNRVKALGVPVCLHTLYDAATATNYLMNSEDEMTSLVGILLGFGCMIVFFFLQIRALVRFKKDTERYCNMTL